MAILPSRLPPEISIPLPWATPNRDGRISILFPRMEQAVTLPCPQMATSPPFKSFRKGKTRVAILPSPAPTATSPPPSIPSYLEMRRSIRFPSTAMRVALPSRHRATLPRGISPRNRKRGRGEMSASLAAMATLSREISPRSPKKMAMGEVLPSRAIWMRRVPLPRAICKPNRFPVRAETSH